MNMTSAPLRFPLLVACLLLAAVLASSLTCRAQEGGGDASSSTEARTASVFAPAAGQALARPSGRPEITAFTKREVVFGLFVLIVGFVGLLVLLPAGLKSGTSSRHGHGGAG